MYKLLIVITALFLGACAENYTEDPGIVVMPKVDKPLPDKMVIIELYVDEMDAFK